MALLSTQCNSTMRLRAVFYISAERIKICRAKVLRHAFTGCFKGTYNERLRKKAMLIQYMNILLPSGVESILLILQSMMSFVV